MKKKKILKEGNENNTNDVELWEAFNTYLTNIMTSLNTTSVNNYITSKENANIYPQQIKCFETHPSITTITKQCLSSSFNFQKSNTNEVMKSISQLNIKRVPDSEKVHLI